MPKQMKVLKTKAWLINGARLWKMINETWSRSWLSVPGKPSAWMHWTTEGPGICTLSLSEALTWNPLPSCIHHFISLQCWCHWYHMQLPTSLIHHHVTFQGGNKCPCVQTFEQKSFAQSTSTCASVLNLFLWSRKWWPQAHTMTLSSRYLSASMHQAYQDNNFLSKYKI